MERQPGHKLVSNIDTCLPAHLKNQKKISMTLHSKTILFYSVRISFF